MFSFCTASPESKLNKRSSDSELLKICPVRPMIEIQKFKSLWLSCPGVASKEQAAKLAENLKQWLDKVPFGVPSTDPRDPRFEPLRYWRGPVWIIINWMIFNGLRHYGYGMSHISVVLAEISLISRSKISST